MDPGQVRLLEAAQKRKELLMKLTIDVFPSWIPFR